MFAGAAAAEPCRDVMHLGDSYTVCTVENAATINLWLKDNDGRVVGEFFSLQEQLAEQGQTLTFAMNGGMYHSDRRPVGALRINGIDLAPLQLNAGPGNFGMLPNGVLCIYENHVLVMSTGMFLPTARPCKDVTQSGPMLVIDGELHPRFIPDSTSRFIRNGVGTNYDDGVAVFAISNDPVNFHTFARFFRDHLGLRQALYFDGNVSRLHATDLNRSDLGFPMGPIVGVVD